MSLINDVLRDLQDRRQGRSGAHSSPVSGVRPVAAPSLARSRRRLPLLAVVLLAAVLAGYAGWKWVQPPEGSSQTLVEHEKPASALSGIVAPKISPTKPSAPAVVIKATKIAEHPSPDPVAAPEPEPLRQDPQQPSISKDREHPALQPLSAQDQKPDEASAQAPPSPPEHQLAAADQSSYEHLTDPPLDKNRGDSFEGLQEHDLEEALDGHDWDIPAAWTRPGLWDENPPPQEPSRPEKEGRFSRTPADDHDVQALYQGGLRALEQGRRQEAETRLREVLQIDPGHETALEALLALLLGQQRRNEALQILSERSKSHGLTSRQAMIYSRLLSGEGKHSHALHVLESVPDPGRSGEYFALLGAVLQHLNMHERSVQAYQNALRAGLRTGAVWAGLGIALEAQKQRGEAREAYRQAMAAGINDPNLARYVNARLAALPQAP